MGFWNSVKQGASRLWQDIKSSPKQVWNKVKEGYQWAEKNIPGVKALRETIEQKVPGASLVTSGLTALDKFINNENVGKAADMISKQLLLRNEQPITGEKPIMRPAVMPTNTMIPNLNLKNRFLGGQQQ